MTEMFPRLPQTAPFTPTQRIWLDGYLAALLGGEGASGAQLGEGAPAIAAPAAEETFPWHDPTMPMEERLKLAEGRPRARVLMSAMAQLDCGQCGYLCQTYSEAIDKGAETSLGRCVPGGRDTARQLKELMATLPAGVPLAAAPAAPAATPVATGPAGRRSAPVRFDAARPLNDPRSDKDTRHVVLRLDEGASYTVGDSFGIPAINCPDLAEAVIENLGIAPDTEVDGPDGNRRPVRDTLLAVCDIARPSGEAIEVLASRATDQDEADRLQALAEGYPGAEPADADLLDLLTAFPSARPPLQELISALGILQPRLYSIASSPKACPGEVHLTVSVVRYKRRSRARKGVASTFLAERAEAGGGLDAFVQEAHGFRLPKAPDTPVIMIGPGTGIAPFRAFLQERRAVGASGRNWLFFGDRRSDYDYLYRGEMEDYRRDGLLTRLDTAFSRDHADSKVYVQQRMRESAAELWAWLQAGAYLYVCGDATHMARDVDRALVSIVGKQGKLESAAAKAYVATLTREGRYLRDVY